MRRGRIFRRFTGIAVLLMVLLIFTESLLPSEISAKQSNYVTRFIYSAVNDVKNFFTKNLSDSSNDIYDNEIFENNNNSNKPNSDKKVPSSKYKLTMRKAIGHYGLFFILGIASVMFWTLAVRNHKKALLIILLSGLAVASLGEIFQLPVFTYGRTATITDVMINYSGYLTAIIIYGIIAAYRKAEALIFGIA